MKGLLRVASSSHLGLLSPENRTVSRTSDVSGPAGHCTSNLEAHRLPSKLKGTRVASSRSLGGRGRAFSTFWASEAGWQGGVPRREWPLPKRMLGGYYTRTRPVSIAQGETGVGRRVRPAQARALPSKCPQDGPGRTKAHSSRARPLLQLALLPGAGSTDPLKGTAGSRGLWPPAAPSLYSSPSHIVPEGPMLLFSLPLPGQR